MSMSRPHILAPAFLMAILIAATTVSASPVTMQMDTVFKGDEHAPTGSAPWIQVMFADTDTVGSVAMTINTFGLQDSEFVSKMYFNFDPALDGRKLKFTEIDQSGTFKSPSFKFDEDKKKAGPAKGFDIELGFKTKNSERFGVGDSISYIITGDPVLTAASFSFENAMDDPDYEFFASAHIQSIGQDYSARIGATDVTDVPEPATMMLLAIGGTGMIAYRRKRKTAKVKID